MKMREYSRSKPRKTRAGRVKMTPEAMDWPALPVVWTMLFARMEGVVLIACLNQRGIGIDWMTLPLQRVVIHLKILIESTAMGIDAATVRPARRPTYTVTPPKTTPKKHPNRMARKVSSRGFSSGETKG